MVDAFHNDSKAFTDWLTGVCMATISPKIALADLRQEDKRRGVGK
jgi:hypothetical protein